MEQHTWFVINQNYSFQEFTDFDSIKQSNKEPWFVFHHCQNKIAEGKYKSLTEIIDRAGEIFPLSKHGWTIRKLNVGAVYDRALYYTLTFNNSTGEIYNRSFKSRLKDKEDKVNMRLYAYLDSLKFLESVSVFENYENFVLNEEIERLKAANKILMTENKELKSINE